MKKHLTIFGLCTLFTITVLADQEILLYKYKDEQGTEVISSTLPGEVANRGYSIVTSRGNVVEIVPPKLTEEEVLEIQKANQLKSKRKEAQLKKRKNEAKQDEMLIKMFDSVKDIERSRNEKLSSVQVQEEITRGNLRRLDEQLKRAFEAVKAHKAQGHKVPDQLQNTIHETQLQLKENQEYLERKAEEKTKLNTQYNKLIERFKYLKYGSTE